LEDLGEENELTHDRGRNLSCFYEDPSPVKRSLLAMGSPSFYPSGPGVRGHAHVGDPMIRPRLPHLRTGVAAHA
jgi:hypothetical protein